MPHKHWPDDHPFYDRAPFCGFATQKACDKNWTQFRHGHLGRPCVKEIKPSKSKKGQPNTIATCTIVNTQSPGLSFAGELARQRSALG